MYKIILFIVCKCVWHRFSIRIKRLKKATNYNTNKYMKNKLLSLASLLAVFNANAIEIGPTGSGIEMSGFIDLYYQDLILDIDAKKLKSHNLQILFHLL